MRPASAYSPEACLVRRRLRTWRSSIASEDQGGMTDLVAAMAGNQGDLRVLDLPLRRIGVSQLPCALDDLQHSLDMGFRELSAGGVAGQGAVHAERAGRDEG